MTDSEVRRDVLTESLQELVTTSAIRPDQATEIAARADETSDERWASPFLGDVPEHTRVYVDALCGALEAESDTNHKKTRRNASE